MSTIDDYDPEELFHEDLEVGRTYRAQMEDCCIAGEFTSELVELVSTYDDGEERLWPALLFANGVALDTYGQVRFYPSK